VKLLVKAAKQSSFIVDALSLDDPEVVENELAIEVTKVNYKVLTKIAEFLNEYVDHPFPSFEQDILNTKSFEELSIL
jgi:hemerythrin-like domain-containing protein